MKKNILLFLIFLYPFFYSNAQDSIPNKKMGLIFKVDVFRPVLKLADIYHFKSFTVTIDKSITNRHSVGLIFHHFWGNPYLDHRYQFQNSYELIPSYRFYISSKKQNEGLYLSTGIVLAKLIADSEIDGYAMSFGGGMGYQKCYKNFVFETNIFYSKIWINSLFGRKAEYHVFLPSINIGYKF